MRARTLFAAVAIGVVGTVSASACRDVIAPKPVDLVTELCALLQDCEGEELECPSLIKDRVPTDAEAEQLLALDADADCLRDCSRARSCRDQAPICKSAGEDCVEGEDCCGFAGGIAACNTSGRCCVPEGAPCGDDAPCCEGQCDDDAHCGDVICKAPGEKCVNGRECCSGSCDGEECIASTCTQPFERCLDDSECCDIPGGVLCLPAGAPDATCQPLTVECEFCDPLDPGNCCVAQGLFCYDVGGGGKTTCGEPNCAPPGAECGVDADCCQQPLALQCDDTALFPHCAP